MYDRVWVYSRKPGSVRRRGQLKDLGQGGSLDANWPRCCFFLSIHADYFIAILITPDDNSGKSALEHLEMGGGLNNWWLIHLIDDVVIIGSKIMFNEFEK